MADNNPPVHAGLDILKSKKDVYDIHGYKLDLDRDYSKYAIPYSCREMSILMDHGEDPLVITKIILLRRLPKQFRKAYIEQRERLHKYIAEDESKKNKQEGDEIIK